MSGLFVRHVVVSVSLHSHHMDGNYARKESEHPIELGTDCVFGPYGTGEKKACSKEITIVNDRRYGEVPVCSKHQHLIQ